MSLYLLLVFILLSSSDDWQLRSDAAATFLTYKSINRQRMGWDGMFPTLMEFSLMLRHQTFVALGNRFHSSPLRGRTSH